MAIHRPKGAKGKCDILFSKIIRSKGFCENCGRSNGVQLQCAHIISRRYSGTRCELMNAWCLCAGCHRRFTDWPREHSKFITETIGSDQYERLREKAEETNKVDWEEVLVFLKGVAKDMGVK